MKKLLLIILLIFHNVSFAKDDTVPMFQFKDASCGSWFMTKDEPTMKQVYSFWFRGFVSGYNYGNKNYYVQLNTLPNNETIFLYVDKYCRDNPLHDFTPSIFKLIDEIKVKR